MKRGADGIAPGLAEVWAVWGMLGLDAAAIYRWYAAPAQGPGEAILARERSGWERGATQLLVFGRHPALPVAIATLPTAFARLPARDRAPVLGAAVAVGGLAGAWVGRLGRDVAPAGWGDAVAAAGVAGSLAMTVGTVTRCGVRGVRPRCGGSEYGGWSGTGGDNSARLAVGVGLVLHGLPWILADLGVYIGDVPPLGRVFLSRQTPPEGGVPAVHLGHHHGMDGTLLAVAALTLSRALPAVRPAPVREALSAYLATLLVYGTMRAAEDGWNEQVVKRGWTSRKIPLVVARGRPVRPRMWAGMVAAAGLVHRGWSRDWH